MDKTWTYGELYAAIQSLAEKYELNPRFNFVINLYASNRYTINECLREMEQHDEYEEVSLPCITCSINEFSIGVSPSGDILLGRDYMIKDYNDLEEYY